MALAEAQLPPLETRVSGLCQGAFKPTESKQVTGAKCYIHVAYWPPLEKQFSESTSICQDMDHDLCI